MEPTVSADITTHPSNGTESPLFKEVYLVLAILAFLAVIGTAGNAIVIYVFNRTKDNSVSTIFILTLAFIDFVICFFNIPFVIFMIIGKFEIRTDFICKSVAFMYTANFLLSAFIMVAIAIDRYFCICHPFKRVMTVTRAKVLVVCMAIIASAIGVCFSLSLSVYYSAPMDSGKFKYGEMFGPTEGRKDFTTGIYQSEIDVSPSALEVIIKQSSAGINPFSGSTETSHAERQNTDPYNGLCGPRDFIFSKESRKALYNLHSALYLFCFVVVLVLYILIYRSVLLQRKSRRHLKKQTHMPPALATQTPIIANCHQSNKISAVKVPFGPSTTHSTSSDDDNLDSPAMNNCPLQIDEGSSALSAESSAARAANLKTAAMLFVVTIVFALSYFPAFLMQHRLIPFNLMVNYMHFVNSVANPIIYSFMNQNFREKVKMLVSRR